MANSKDHFTVSANAGMAAKGNGVYTESLAGGDANINFDPGKLGKHKTVSMGEVDIGLAEAVVHESGHGIEPYFANVQAINARYGAVANTQGEAFSMFLENAWRRMEAGKANNDIRMFIFTPGDVRYEGTKLESIWP